MSEFNSLYALFYINPYMVLNFCESGSGCASIFLEILFFLYALDTSPLWGLGLDYGGLPRTMTLNGISEIILKFGIIGSSIIFYSLSAGVPKGVMFPYIACIMCFLLSNGSLSQPYFWIWLTPIYCAFQIMNRNKKLND